MSALKSLKLVGFKSFAKKATLHFTQPITAIVGPNGSGKSNVAEALRFVLGEQRISQMRGKRTEDLIWNGSPKVGKSSRAHVSLTFDNTSKKGKKLFDIDFDKVEIGRTIFRDSSTEYAVNGSAVRLKDVVELLSGAHIGASGHHIISQGETDRILNVNARERKEMIEDALGLKIYQYKKEESLRKLEKTEENKKEVISRRREVAPHLKFLKGQVEKIEKTRGMREELEDLYRTFFAQEEQLLSLWEKRLEKERIPLEKEKEDIDISLASARKHLEESTESDEQTQELVLLEKKLSDARVQKDAVTRELGQLEGRVAALEGVLKREEVQTVPVKQVRAFTEKLTTLFEESTELRELVGAAKQIIKSFLASVSDSASVSEQQKELDAARIEQQEATKKLSALEQEEKLLSQKYKALQKRIEGDKDSSREAERVLFELTTRETDVRMRLEHLEAQRKEYALRKEELKEEKREAVALVGRGAFEKQSEEHSKEKPFDELKNIQTKHKKELERLKIRVEDAGGGSGDEILKEYEEVSERDAFLERELEDLTQSAEKLKQLIAELDEKLRSEFREGLEKVNGQFQELFALMFGGGSAALKVVKEKTRREADIEMARVLGESASDDDVVEEEGVVVSVSLPRKRVSGLEMLSGGERALTSIALLFALSQVNPPPFLVLDETDAALDEANSRRYGDLIERLSKDSQLIVITHNRETMSRAGVLYGVTMGADGVSQLLSVDFTEAVKVAK